MRKERNNVRRPSDGRVYPLPLHNGENSEVSDVYLRALANFLDIDWDEFRDALGMGTGRAKRAALKAIQDRDDVTDEISVPQDEWPRPMVEQSGHSRSDFNVVGPCVGYSTSPIPRWRRSASIV